MTATAATPEDAVAGSKASGATLACLCGDDADLRRARGQAFAAAVKAAGVKGLRSPAGRAKPSRACARRESTISSSSGGDAVAALQGLYRRLGA